MNDDESVFPPFFPFASFIICFLSGWISVRISDWISDRISDRILANVLPLLISYFIKLFAGDLQCEFIRTFSKCYSIFGALHSADSGYPKIGFQVPVSPLVVVTMYLLIT